MGHRKFVDRQGYRWEVKVTSKADWRFEPVPGNPNEPKHVRPPLYAGEDPYELSEQELQSILGETTAIEATPRKSPFGGTYEPPKKKSPFLDDQ